MSLRDEVYNRINAEYEAVEARDYTERLIEHKELLKERTLGKACSQFLNSDVGRYILDRAIEDEKAAKAALVAIKPTDTEGIIELQQQAYVPALILTWLNEAIQGADENELLIVPEGNHSDY